MWSINNSFKNSAWIYLVYNNNKVLFFSVWVLKLSNHDVILTAHDVDFVCIKATVQQIIT